MGNLLRDTIQEISPQDLAFRSKARARLEQLTMPHWALGRLMDLAEDLAGMTRSMHPPVSNKTVVVMAGDHGVVAEGVSKYPSEVTPQMVHNIVNRGAGINALAQCVGARVVVVDMGVASDLGSLAHSGKLISKKVGWGTRNMAMGPSMTRAEAEQSLEAGIEVASSLQTLTDVFATGDMGIGNTTPSTAILCCFSGAQAHEVTGRGTGLDDAQLRHKSEVLTRALELNRPDPRDGLDVLAKVGGFEIGGIAGLILGAAAQRKPVVVDGLISTAGALIASSLAPAAMEYVVPSHRSQEPGHQAMWEFLKKKPLLDLEMRLGEGTGAVLAMGLLENAKAILTQVSTFEEASVSKANQ